MPLPEYLPPVELSETERQAMRRASLGRELEAGFKARIDRTLSEIGVPPRLKKAIPEVVPEEIASLKVWNEFPKKSFGLIGPGGLGKSCALVAAIKRAMLAEYTKAYEAGFQDDLSLQTEFKWIGWPAMAARMKSLASRREWDHTEASIAWLIEWVKENPRNRVLILDDLGMEPFNREGAYTTEQVGLLLDVCYNWEMRVFWTSNRKLEELAEPSRYDYRVVSRLGGIGPIATLSDSLPDLRVKG